MNNASKVKVATQKSNKLLVPIFLLPSFARDLKL